MPLTTWLFRIMGDSSNATRTLDAFEKRAQRTEHKVGLLFKRFALGAIGLRELNSIGSAIIRWSKDIDAAREEFKRLGIQMDESILQRLAITGQKIQSIRAQASVALAPFLEGVVTVASRASVALRIWFDLYKSLFTLKSTSQAQASTAKILEEFREHYAALQNAPQLGGISKMEEILAAKRKLREDRQSRHAAAHVTVVDLLLTKEEKINRIIEERAQLLKIINDSTTSGIAREEAIIRGKVLDAEMIRTNLALINENQDRFKNTNIDPDKLNSLAQIGGFTGRPDSTIIRVQERIMRASEETAGNTRNAGVGFQ